MPDKGAEFIDFWRADAQECDVLALYRSSDTGERRTIDKAGQAKAGCYAWENEQD